MRVGQQRVVKEHAREGVRGGGKEREKGIVEYGRLRLRARKESPYS